MEFERRQNRERNKNQRLNGMKTEVAKKYLREANYNITQIAEMLGYANIHYFSRQFKKTTGMTPTEYAISIRAMVEK